jgi:hypothetical protein
VLPALLPWALLVWQAWQGRRGARLAWAASGLLCVAAVPAIALRGAPDHADIGAALRSRLAPGDRVVVTGEPFFDLRLQAGLAEPPAVLADWDRLRHERGDNWQHELLDAARFDPVQGERVLWTAERLARERCAPGRLWLVATRTDALPGAQPVVDGRRGSLFLLPRPAACP